MATRVNIWITVGESNAGKSSSIRALTGVRDQNVYSLEAVAGYTLHNVLTIPSALQEWYQIQPADFIARVQGNYPIIKGAGAIAATEQPSGHAFDHVLIALRQNGINGCPDANDNITAFSAAGWHVQVPVVHLQLPGCTFVPTPPHISIDVPATQNGVRVPSNARAHAMRKAWGWL